MTYPITEIEGIGPTYASRLAEFEITDTGALLAKCGPKSGRKQIAETLGLSEGALLRWVNHADLMRIKGVGAEYAELLEGAGVDSVKELRRRNPANLAERMSSVNATRHLTRVVPGTSTIASWVEAAKELEASEISH
jgi:predicted flap endonuclease-1-like 5' DNA nuclease